jgi:hypothetical protein
LLYPNQKGYLMTQDRFEKVIADESRIGNQQRTAGQAQEHHPQKAAFRVGGGETSPSDIGEHIENDLLNLPIDRKPLKWPGVKSDDK